MRKYRFGNKKSLAIMSVFMLISSILGGASLYALSFITDYAVAGQVDKLLEIAKILLLVIIIELVVNLIASYLKSQYLFKSSQDLKIGYVERLFNLDIKDLSQNDEEVYLSNLSNDVDRYEERFFLKVIDLIEVFGQIAVSLFLLYTVNTLLLLSALILLVFFIFISKKTSKPVADKEKVKSKSLLKYTNYISETLSGFFVIKQNSLEALRISKFKDLAKQVQKDNYEVDKKATQVDALNSFIQTVIIFTLIFAGLYFAIKSKMSLGTTLLAGSAFSNSIWPMQRITPYISQMSGISVVLSDFEKTLSQKEGKESIEIKQIESIQFKMASLGYKDEVVLKAVNLEIRKNEKVLIIGSSGAGKSTILKSLRRQLPIKSGEILVNNQKLSMIYSKAYYQQLAVVDQIGFIFNASLQDNITLYKDGNSKHLERVLSQVGLSNLDLTYPLKNNGSNLSGGQRARLLLARALYLDASLIICDEIFASLDHKVGEALEYEMLNIDKTLINVSHIMYEKNLKLYDKIYLVEAGSVSLVSDYSKIYSLDKAN